MKFRTRLLESVAGGHVESGFWASSAGLAGPGSLLLRSAPTTFCNAATLPTAAAAVPMKLRRVNSLIRISFRALRLSWRSQNCSRHARHTWYKMAIRTSIRPFQTNRISSRRLCRTTGTSFSTFGSRSKNRCRLRKMRIPPSRKMITARVNATRSAGTPACSITAITRELFAFMAKSYRCLRSILQCVRRIFRCYRRRDCDSPFGGKCTRKQRLAIRASASLTHR